MIIIVILAQVNREHTHIIKCTTCVMRYKILNIELKFSLLNIKVYCLVIYSFSVVNAINTV